MNLRRGAVRTTSDPSSPGGIDAARLAAEAADPATPTTRLQALSASDDVSVARALAGNPATPPEVLERLASSERPSITERLASNPNTPLPVLWSLASAHGARVMANPMFALVLLTQPELTSYPLPVLEHLAREPEWVPGGHGMLLELSYHQRVRFRTLPALVARNPHASGETLRRLAWLHPTTIELGSHPALPADVMTSLVERYRSRRNLDGLAECARNPSATPELLTALSWEFDEWIRQAAAANPRLPPDDLLRLLSDTSHYVRSAARQNPVLCQVLRRRGQSGARAFRAITSRRSQRGAVRTAPASRRA